MGLKGGKFLPAYDLIDESRELFNKPGENCEQCGAHPGGLGFSGGRSDNVDCENDGENKGCYFDTNITETDT